MDKKREEYIAKKLIEMFRMNMETNNDSVEKIEIRKKNVKTSLIVSFDKDGYVTDVDAMSEYIPSPEEETINKLMLLKKELQEAIENEDFIKAAELKKQIDELPKPTETNK